MIRLNIRLLTCWMFKMLESGYSRLSVLMLVLLLSNIQSGICIDCYDCNSGDDNCGEVPNGDLLIKDGKVASGCPSCVKKFNALGTIWSSVTRRCGTSSETTDSCSDVLGYGKCVCTTTFCNHGNSAQLSKSVLMFTFASLLVFS